jgi:hypothetical protein
MRLCEEYRYELEALRCEDQTIFKSWEMEGYATLKEATERAKHLASGYDIDLKADGYNQIVINELLYDDRGECDGSREVACFDIE